MNKGKSVSMSSDPDKGCWRKSITNDGVTKAVEVRKIENGYLITVGSHGQKKNDKGEEEWFDTTREMFSKINPLEEEDDEFKNEKKMIEDMKKSLYTPSIFDLV